MEALLAKIQDLVKKSDWIAVVHATQEIDTIENPSAQLLEVGILSGLNAMKNADEDKFDFNPDEIMDLYGKYATLLKATDAALFEADNKKGEEFFEGMTFENLVLLREMKQDMLNDEPVDTEALIKEQPNYKILKALAEDGSKGFNLSDFEQIEFDTYDKTYRSFSANGTMFTLVCFPYEDGSYAALFSAAVVDTVYSSYIFRDGALTPVDYLFPKPTVADFFTNVKDMPKPVQDALEDAVKSSRYIYTYDSFDNELRTNLGLEFTKENEFMVSCLIPNMPQVAYTWDGSKFVISSNWQPKELDLTIFN